MNLTKRERAFPYLLINACYGKRGEKRNYERNETLEENNVNKKPEWNVDYVRITQSEEFNSINVYFENEMDKPFAIGEKMYSINEQAYMNGYNWDALFNYYLSKNAPEVLEGMDSDPEAGSYVAHYERTPQNEVKAEKFKKIIASLIENEEELYRMVRDEGDVIEWD
jgi:hypothetical protein